MKYSVINLQTA